MKRVEDQKALAAAVAGKKAVVLFHATWCPFCRAFLPVFEKAMRAGKHEAVEAVLDDEENPLWAEHGINLVPTVLFFDKGKVVRRLDGKPGAGLTEADLEQALG